MHKKSFSLSENVINLNAFFNNCVLKIPYIKLVVTFLIKINCTISGGGGVGGLAKTVL